MNRKDRDRGVDVNKATGFKAKAKQPQFPTALPMLDN